MPSCFVWLAPKSLAGAYRVCAVGSTVGTRGLTLGVVVRAFSRDLLSLVIHHKYTASESLRAVVCGRSISSCAIGAALTRSGETWPKHYSHRTNSVCALS